MSESTSPAEPRPAPTRAWWLAGLVLIVPALWALISLATELATPAAGPPTLRGVRLGMTADQVRDRFDLASSPGATWRTEVSGTDIHLVRSPAGSLDREARFEIHEGMLVAVRLDLPADAPEAQGPQLEISALSVLSREPSEGARVRVRLLSRTCPTHAAEVSQILAARQ